MKKYPAILFTLLICGCSLKDEFTTKNVHEVNTFMKLSIRQIDSLTAESNFSFSYLNKVENNSEKATIIK